MEGVVVWTWAPCSSSAGAVGPWQHCGMSRAPLPPAPAKSQALSSGAQRQDKGQRAQTEAEEAPAEPEEELLPSEGDGALEQAAQGGFFLLLSFYIFC